MKLYYFVIPALLFTVTPVLAGQISGTIRSGNGPLANTNITIQCGETSGAGKTDANGRYSIYVAATGSCTLKINGASAVVFSSNQPTQHNFVLNGAVLNKN